MIQFQRYSHINDLIDHYANEFDDRQIMAIMKNGVSTEEEATALSRFIWRMAGQMNEDSEAGKMVLGATDNSEMGPDLAYEILLYMKNAGYKAIWEKVSKEEMESDEETNR